jgi:hypothetical protein
MNEKKVLQFVPLPHSFSTRENGAARHGIAATCSTQFCKTMSSQRAILQLPEECDSKAWRANVER